MRKFLLSIAVAAGLVGFAAPSAGAKPARPSSSCVKALDASSDLRIEAGYLFSATSTFFQKLHDNAAGNVDDMLTFVRTLTTDTQDLGATFSAERSKMDDITGRIDRFGTQCRRGK